MGKNLESLEDWIVIGKYDGSILAEMAKGILTDNDIPCYIKGDFFSTAYNINALSMPGGSVKLYIPKAFKTKAEELIKDIIPSNEEKTNPFNQRNPGYSS